MEKLSNQTRFYIITSILVGILLGGASLAQWDWQQNGLLSIVLAGLASLCLIFKVEGSTNRTHYDVTFIVYGFTLVLLGAPEAVFVVVLAHLIEWMRHKYPWYIQAFNIASYIIVAVATSMVYELLNPARVMGTWQSALAMLVAMAAFVLLNHLMVGVIVWLARGENFQQSGIFQIFPLMLDWIMLCMGAGAALIWHFNPLAVILVLLPVYLIYTTLRVPALERKTQVDVKTGLYNLNYFMDAFEKELHRAIKFERPLSIVMADLDLLRNINNTYGHLAGDEVLIGVAKILKEHSREFDVVCRFGGEEFAILMTETSPEQAYPLAQSIRKAIENMEFTVPTSVTPIRATMSFGIAGTQDTLDCKGIIHNADMALYHAKLKGRNQVFVYTNEGFEQLMKSPQKAKLDTAALPTTQVSQPEASAAANPQPLPGGEAEPAPVSNPPDKGNYSGNEKNSWIHRHKVSLYIAVLAMLAATFFALSLSFSQTQDWTGILLFTALVVATEWTSVNIYARNTSISTSAVPLIAGILLFGPVSALVMGSAIAAVALIKHHSPFSRFLFNLSNQVLAAAACTFLLHSVGIEFSSWPILFQVLASAAAGLVIYLLTSSGVAVGIHFQFGAPLREIWVEQFGWLAPYYLVMGVIAYTLVYGYHQSGIIGSVAVLVPLFLLRLSQKQYIDRTKEAVTELRKKNKALEEHSKEITRLNNGLLDTLALVIDLRDPYVLGHSLRVTNYAVTIAQEMRLTPAQIETIRKASLMHDLGKLGIQTEVLAKTSSLTPAEFNHVKSHVTVGAELLKKSQALQPLIPIVLHHHEHYDGKGYPDGLKGKNIPLEARIVCLADAVDAMSSTRPYRKGFSPEEVLKEVRRCSGSHFDPEVVKAFERAIQNNSAALATDISARDAEGVLTQNPPQLHPVLQE